MPVHSHEQQININLIVVNVFYNVEINAIFKNRNWNILS